jgi:glycosyltransferase involved in cell wall biosynthesis
MFEVMACGVPIILGVAGEAEQILTESEAGLCIAPEREDELAGAILELYNDPELRSRLSTNGPCYVQARFDRRHLADQYLDVLEEVVSETSVFTTQATLSQ